MGFRVSLASSISLLVPMSAISVFTVMYPSLFRFWSSLLLFHAITYSTLSRRWNSWLEKQREEEKTKKNKGKRKKEEEEEELEEEKEEDENENEKTLKLKKTQRRKLRSQILLIAWSLFVFSWMYLLVTVIHLQPHLQLVKATNLQTARHPSILRYHPLPFNCFSKSWNILPPLTESIDTTFDHNETHSVSLICNDLWSINLTCSSFAFVVKKGETIVVAGEGEEYFDPAKTFDSNLISGIVSFWSVLTLGRAVFSLRRLLQELKPKPKRRMEAEVLERKGRSESRKDAREEDQEVMKLGREGKKQAGKKRDEKKRKKSTTTTTIQRRRKSSEKKA